MTFSLIIDKFSSVTQLCVTVYNTMNFRMPDFPLHHQLLELTQTHVHPAISSSVVSFPSCLQSFPAPGPFHMSQFFASGGQSIGVSASASVLPMKIQDWFPLGLTDWISLHSNGLSRVFSNTTVQKHRFFSAQFFIVQLSHPYMTTAETIALTRWIFVSKVISLIFNVLSRLV